LTLCGGLSDGDSNVLTAIPIIGRRSKEEKSSASIVIAEPGSLLWNLEAAAV
jgi:hypothetical protein